MDERVKALEEDLARLELEHRALLELCLKKNLFTRAELAALRQQIDSVDGSADGRDAKVPRPKD